MKLLDALRTLLVLTACTGILCPQLVQAANRQVAYPNLPGPQSADTDAFNDIALADDGTLHGLVLDQQGQAVADERVGIVQDEQLVAQTQTNHEGRFSVTGLSGGLYQIVTSAGVQYCRVWAPRTAPPAASPQALVVHGGNVLVRGAGYGNHPLRFLGNPWVLAGIVATAIALPLALDEDDAS